VSFVLQLNDFFFIITWIEYSLETHSHHEVVVAIANIDIGNYFYSKDETHNKNNKIYTNKGNELILSLVQVKIYGSSKKI